MTPGTFTLFVAVGTGGALGAVSLPLGVLAAVTAPVWIKCIRPARRHLMVLAVAEDVYNAIMIRGGVNPGEYFHDAVLRLMGDPAFKGWSEDRVADYLSRWCE